MCLYLCHVMYSKHVLKYRQSNSSNRTLVMQQIDAGIFTLKLSAARAYIEVY